MTATHITDHVARAIARLPMQLRDKTLLVEFLTVLVSPIQEIEDALWDMLVKRYVDTAEGAVLDVIGRIVQQTRPSADDALYRLHIKARIATRRSRGTVNELIAIVRLLVSEDAVIVVERQNIATIVIRVTDAALDDDTADVLISFLRKAASAGVRLILESSSFAPSSWLQLDVDNLDEERFLDVRT